MKVRQASPGDLPELVRMFQELDRMQRDWRVFTPRPGFYDEVADKYRRAMGHPDALVMVAEDDGEVVGMGYAEVRVPSRFSGERALEHLVGHPAVEPGDDDSDRAPVAERRALEHGEALAHLDLAADVLNARPVRRRLFDHGRRLRRGAQGRSGDRAADSRDAV